MFLIILLLFSILQIYICKNQKSRKVTLILPIISLIVAIVSIIFFFFIILSALLNDLILSNTKNINIIISYLIDFDLEYIFLLFLIYVCLLFSFLPTMVFCSINIYYKKLTYKK